MTYRLIEDPTPSTDGKYTLYLSELPDESTFKIKVEGVIELRDNEITGLITGGPENFINKTLHAKILAGYDLEGDLKAGLRDASFAKKKRIKKLGKLVQGDRVKDITAPFAADVIITQ